VAYLCVAAHPGYYLLEVFQLLLFCQTGLSEHEEESMKKKKNGMMKSDCNFRWRAPGRLSCRL
jgi:hypothetical protein